MENRAIANKLIFVVGLVLCLMPFINPPLALLIGLVVSQTIGNPFLSFTQKATSWLLKSSIVGIGFGMSLHEAIKAGQEGFVFTAISISATLLLGWLLGKWLKIDNKTSYLISSGTAICGASAIAAVSPIIKADQKQISVALGIVFILNLIALFIFPFIGNWLAMTQHQFGLWCAIAIHDTSSVVGTATKYGQEALQVATTVKLERALWIIPLSLLTFTFLKGKNKKITIPYFIGFFILAMCFSNAFPQFNNVYTFIVAAARKGLNLTFFLIGAGLSMATLKSVGVKPFIQGVLLWLVVSVVSLVVIMGLGE
jgi:uncharacterized integral membrane protein (TIGR00698 family)